MLRQLYPYVLWLAIACWAFFFFGSQEIAISMGDAALQPLMEVVSFTFYSFQFFLSIVGIFKVIC